MAELEDKLNQILSNPDSMKKVMDLASGLMSAQQNGSTASQQTTGQPGGLSGLLGTLGQGNSPAPAASGGGMDLSALLAPFPAKKEEAVSSRLRQADPPEKRPPPAALMWPCCPS